MRRRMFGDSSEKRPAPKTKAAAEPKQQTAMAKHADHMPLEPQVRAMQREGLEVDSQTLWDQLSALGNLVAPAHERLHTYVLSQPVVGADETHWRLMGEKNTFPTAGRAALSLAVPLTPVTTPAQPYLPRAPRARHQAAHLRGGQRRPESAPLSGRDAAS